MTRKALNLFVDHALIPLFVLTLVSGIMVHVAEERSMSHEAWHNRSVFHIIASLLLAVAGAVHIYLHKAWYKNLFRVPLYKQNHHITLLTIALVVMVLTGIILFASVDGPQNSLGDWHYRIGLSGFGILGLYHLVRRIKRLAKMSR